MVRVLIFNGDGKPLQSIKEWHVWNGLNYVWSLLFFCEIQSIERRIVNKSVRRLLQNSSREMTSSFVGFWPGCLQQSEKWSDSEYILMQSWQAVWEKEKSQRWLEIQGLSCMCQMTNYSGGFGRTEVIPNSQAFKPHQVSSPGRNSFSHCPGSLFLAWLKILEWSHLRKWQRQGTQCKEVRFTLEVIPGSWMTEQGEWHREEGKAY